MTVSERLERLVDYALSRIADKRGIRRSFGIEDIREVLAEDVGVSPDEFTDDAIATEVNARDYVPSMTKSGYLWLFGHTPPPVSER